MTPMKIKMQKINIGPADSAAKVTEEIISSVAEEVVLRVPKFSRLGEEAENFELLKREADAAGKKIFIESVDDDVLEMAEKSGIEGRNPVLRFGSGKRRVSDITPSVYSTYPAGRLPKETEAKEDGEPEKKPEEQPAILHLRVEKEEKPPASEVLSAAEKRKFEREEKIPIHVEEAAPETISVKWRLPEIFRKRRIVYFAGAAIIFLAAAAYLALTVLPRAAVSVVLKKADWSYDGIVAVDKNAAENDLDKMKIPGQTFGPLTKNATMSFPASLKKSGEQKAKGKIKIFNAFGPNAQTLVATTRFEAPDGKIFRIDEKVTVPGAKVVDGRMTTSSVEVSITADKPGTEYNIGSVEKLTVPGFKGTPKYDGFYGAIEESLSGGFVGETAAPSEQDLSDAKSKMAQVLRDNLSAELVGQMPEGFKTVDGGSVFKILRENIIIGNGQGENFSVFAEGEMSGFAFSEQTLRDLLVAKGRKESGDGFLNPKNVDLSYAPASSDFSAGVMSLPVKFGVSLESGLDQEAFKGLISGKKEGELGGLSFPGIEKITVSFWPFWVREVPSGAARVKVSAE
ncbi:MAG: hypothetical protein HZA37_02145 [Parcubacteria group bacterium]|nr:hypothetical protein [Parcubacteria group bacterium]